MFGHRKAKAKCRLGDAPARLGAAAVELDCRIFRRRAAKSAA
jgi:hypothetical protein